jgi:hypothetical protein
MIRRDIRYFGNLAWALGEAAIQVADEKEHSMANG